MRPSEIRERILAEHHRVRALASEATEAARAVIDAASRREEVGDASSLRDAALQLETGLAELFDEEEEILQPALRDADSWGEVRADQLAEHHAVQRMVVQQACAEVEAGRLPPRRLADELLELAGDVLEGLDRSERAFLHPDLLRDDVVTIGQTSG